MGPKKDGNKAITQTKRQRFKITCLECNVDMDSDYRSRHNRLFHAKMLKEHKVIRWQTLDAPKDPFAAARPAKIPRTSEATDEVPTSSATTAEPKVSTQDD